MGCDNLCPCRALNTRFHWTVKNLPGSGRSQTNGGTEKGECTTGRCKLYPLHSSRTQGLTVGTRPVDDSTPPVPVHSPSAETTQSVTLCPRQTTTSHSPGEGILRDPATMGQRTKKTMDVHAPPVCNTFIRLHTCVSGLTHVL